MAEAELDVGGQQREEIDVRSTEVENVGDEDELDADLERQFLLRQESKLRQEQAFDKTIRTPLTPEEANIAGMQFLQFPGITPEWELSLERKLYSDSQRKSDTKRKKCDEIREIRILSEPKQNILGADHGELEFGSQFKSDNMESFGRDAVQVSLMLRQPFNSYNTESRQKLVPNFSERQLMSGSSSKVSTANCISLNRQHTTGPTSTVESPVQLERKLRSLISVPREANSLIPGPPRLMFAFPGWVVDMIKGDAYHPPVVSRYSELTAIVEPLERPSKRLREGADQSEGETVSLEKVVNENLGDRSPVCELPDEIILHVMRRLDIRDLCSSIQTCQRWHAIGLQNNLWEHLHGYFDCKDLSDSGSDVLPRWLCKKNLVLSENVRARFNVFSKGYDFLQRASHEWWNNGLQSSRYPSKGMHSLIKKLTAHDWSLLYEALGVLFTDRADRIATILFRKLKPVYCLAGKGASVEHISDEKRGFKVAFRGSAPMYENLKTGLSVAGTCSEFEVHWKSGSVKEVTETEGTVGKELWEALLKSWKRFKAWLLLISTHCPDLNSEVMLERARSLNRTATPTLYEKGLICFRSQVVLRYGLRSVLQAGFMFLTTQDARDCTSEQDMDLLRFSHHLLQELDVPDDFTLPLRSHTQTKLRHCFRNALLTNSKLALHMNDRLNHL